MSRRKWAAEHESHSTFCTWRTIRTTPSSCDPPGGEGIPCANTCVQNHDDFVAALEHGGIDLVLSDCTLPAFDGISALKIVHISGRPYLSSLCLARWRRTGH